MKKISRLIAVILVLGILSGVSWFAWSRQKYGQYIGGMEKSVFYTFLTPRYDSFDRDGYDFGVKYPDVLTLTGNLSITSHWPEDRFNDVLIIWPKVNGDYEYGVILYDEEESYQVEINERGETLDSGYEEITKNHSDSVHGLLQAANRQWSDLT